MTYGALKVVGIATCQPYHAFILRQQTGHITVPQANDLLLRDGSAACHLHLSYLYNT